MFLRTIAIFVIFFAFNSNAKALRIAVASNFSEAAEGLIKNFEKQTGHQVLLSKGSSGKLYSQIKNGAPFDIFLSADSLRPQLLVKDKKAIEGSLFTYAKGKLVLWSKNKNTIIKSVGDLKKLDLNHAAMANPIHAPYGKAAFETIKRMNLWNNIKSKVVIGENISQAFQFVYSGSADVGFVALSQVIKRPKGTYIVIPQNMYPSIEQAAVLLETAKDNSVAKDFLSYVKSVQGKKVISRYGYE